MDDAVRIIDTATSYWQLALIIIAIVTAIAILYMTATEVANRIHLRRRKSIWLEVTPQPQSQKHQRQPSSSFR